ncbi:hypothetical protein C5E10_15880 [Pseudoclavibacter sp. RFBG4]|uniref:DsbA family protein n=1 Tax=Pseudoclavibacter sp. RFBG4 TaxID=2080575 RepID=UPI000CE7E405|nr:thioredoxin domain-containing protein [Pseudoclavibacter sp. RFBG4]PPG26743.1 hypothetical protein C5E10_15880 [Pseudoclavibacter sp. RFBG4]
MAGKDRERVQKFREEANAIRRAEESRSRRNRWLAQLGIISGSVVVLAAIVLLAVFGSTWFGSRTVLEARGYVEVPSADGSSVEQPISASASGIAVGRSDAAMKIDYYFDFSCPHCVDYHAATGQAYNDLVASGTAQITYHPMNIIAPYGAQAGAALAAAVSADPASFYEVRDGLYGIPGQTQSAWGPEDYATALTQMGIADDAALEATAKGEYVDWVAGNTSLSREAGVTSTPTIAIDGQLQLNDQGQSSPPDAEAIAALN